eukprot:IDg1794t1
MEAPRFGQLLRSGGCLTRWVLRPLTYKKKSGRLWYLTSDYALTGRYRFTKSKFELTFSNGDLNFVLGTQVEKYIYAGKKEMIISFEEFLQKKFDIGELKNQNFEINDYGGEEVAKPEEFTAYKIILGKCCSLGHCKKTTPEIRFNSSGKKEEFVLQVYCDALISPKREDEGRGDFVVFRQVHAAADAVSAVLCMQELHAKLTYRPEAELVMEFRSVFNSAASLK